MKNACDAAAERPARGRRAASPSRRPVPPPGTLALKFGFGRVEAAHGQPPGAQAASGNGCLAAQDWLMINSHTKWQCKYPVVFIPKYRRKTLFGVVRRELGPWFRRYLAEQEAEDRRLDPLELPIAEKG